MADLVIVDVDVEEGPGAIVQGGVAGEAIKAGQPVYLDSASSRYKLARANAESTDDVAGVTINNSQDGQRMDFVVAGRLIVNAVVVPGEVYALSAAAAGGIAPVGDLIAGDFVTVLGIGINTTAIQVQIQVSGVAK